MPRLIGFQYTKKPVTSGGTSGGASSDQLLRIAEKAYLNQTRYGEYGTVEDVQGFIDRLEKLPQTPDIIEKVADLRNKALQLESKKDDILQQKNIFDYNLQVQLDEAARNNIKYPKSLIQEYARIYGEADANYDDQVLSHITQKYGTKGEIPNDVLNTRRDLKEKATWYSTIINAYNRYGKLDTKGYAFQIDTNPTNGNIVHVNIVPSGEVDKSNYMRANVGVKVSDDMPEANIPMYLRTNDIGRTEDGMTVKGALLGNLMYKEGIDVSGSRSRSLNELQLEKDKIGLRDTLSFWSNSEKEARNKAIDQINSNGVDFSTGDYKYDNLDIPKNSVVSVGKRLFYNTDKGDLLEISGKTNEEKQQNLSGYFSANQLDLKNILPYTTTSDYLKSVDDTPRIKGKIDENYLKPATTIQPKWGGIQPVRTQIQETSTSKNDGFFTKIPSPIKDIEKRINPNPIEDINNRINRLNKPETSPITSQGETSMNDLIESGKSFFRNRLA